MDPKEPCPSRDQLEEVMRGKIASPQLELLAHHMEACPKCEETLQTICAEDTFTDMFREEAGKAEPPVEPAVKALIRRMQEKDVSRGAPTLDSNEIAAQPADAGTQAFSDVKVSAADTLDFLAPPQGPEEIGRLGQYRVLKVLGKGGMGMVLMAHDPHLDRMAALKVMLPSIAANQTAKQRFLREARTAAKLRSDHIVTIYQVSEDRGIPYLAMEYLEGAPLDQFLAGDRKLTLPQILRIAREIAKGLADAHERGLIHRDIKPGNIWLDKTHGGRATILDFGLARFDTDIHITQSGAIIGTPAYMAPEQARGEKVDARADLFSLGCVLYRLCAGDIPFKAETTMGVLMALAIYEPTPPVKINSLIPQALSELIMKLLEKDATKRPVSARDVIARLQEIERTIAGSAPNEATNLDLSLSLPPMAEVLPSAGLLTALEQAKAEPKPSAAPRKRRPVGLGAMVLLGLLLLGGAGTWALMQMGVIRFSNEQGDYVIATDDPDFAFSVSKGSVVLEDRKTKRKYNLKVIGGNKVAGEYELEVTDLDADLAFKTKNFTIKRGQEVALKAWFERKQVAGVDPPAKGTPSDPDRRAAERALGLGATVKINGEKPHEEIRAIADLPKTPFTLTLLGFTNNQKVTDADLAIFKDCTGLMHLGFDGCPKITDAGMAHFRDCKNLVHLNVSDTRITNDGLAHFKDCKLTDLRVNKSAVTATGLAYFKDCRFTLLDARNTPLTDDAIRSFTACQEMAFLWLGGTKVTDDGLAHFKDCKQITGLELTNTAVTDAGLTHFANCKRLAQLSLARTGLTDAGLATFKDCDGLQVVVLNDTKVTDAGLAHLKDCKSLGDLSLAGTKVTDGGLVHLKGCKLTRLDLNLTAVTDAGLDHLKGHPGLTALQLRQTRVTAEGVKSLMVALPKCRIEWDGGVIDPTASSDPDRRAAEYIVSVKGMGYIEVAGKPIQIHGSTKLPAEPFMLRNADLAFLVTDAGLAAFQGCKNLKSLQVGQNSKITDAGLVHFKDCHDLENLNFLYSGNIGDEGLANFKNCKNLTHLHLGVTKVTDAGLAHFKDCKNLVVLNLDRCTAVTDAGLANFNGSRSVTALNLVGLNKVTDTGFAAFKDCSFLTNLAITGTSISDRGLTQLRGAKFLTYLGLANSPNITAAGLANLQSCERLEEIHLGTLQITAQGLESLKNLKRLESLWFHDGKDLDKALVGLSQFKSLKTINLAASPVNDAALAHVAQVKSLAELRLGGKGITDAGLKHLAPMESLRTLVFLGTEIGDAGLEHLVGMKGLRELNLQNSKVTPAGVKKLAAALPRCRIVWTGGVIEPTITTPVFAAENEIAAKLRAFFHYLDIRFADGKQVRVGGDSPLPKAPFQVVGIGHPNLGVKNSKITTEVLDVLSGLTALESFSCENVEVRFGDADVERLAGFAFKNSLRVMTGYVMLTPKSLVALKQFPQLRTCLLGVPKEHLNLVSGLKELPSLEELWLVNQPHISNPISPLGDAEWQEIAQLPLQTLRIFQFGGGGIDAKGLDRLATTSKIEHLMIVACKLDDGSLQAIGKFAALKSIDFHYFEAPGASLRHLANLKSLRELVSRGNRLEDTALPALANVQQLTRLDLREEHKLTEPAIRTLAKALPGCKIEWKGGVIEPSK